MKFFSICVVLSLFCGLAVSLKPDRFNLSANSILGHVSEWCNGIRGDDAQPYGAIKNLIEGIVKQLEGHKENHIEELELSDSIRFRDVTFESTVEKIRVDIEEPRGKVNIREMVVPISLVNINGQYQFTDILLPGGLLIYGNGNFKIKFVDLNLALSLKAQYQMKTGDWDVKNVTVDTSLGDSLIRFENLMDGEPMGEFLNTMIDELAKVVVDLLPGFVEQYKPFIMEEISKIINQLISGTNVADCSE